MLDADDESLIRGFRLQVEIGLDGSSFLKGVGEERFEISPALAECAQCDADVWIRRPDGTVERVRVAVPQPMRRRLYERAEGCCEVCGIRLEPQLHHLWLLSEGGKHDIDQMIVLCKAHHDRVHEGSLWILGTRQKGFRFTMADGTPYGSGAPSSKAVTNIDAFQVLRRLGYKEKEIRPVLETLMARDLSLEDLLAEALRLLCPTWDAKKKRPAAPKPAHARAAEKPAPASARQTAEGAAFVAGATPPAEDAASSPESPTRPTWDENARNAKGAPPEPRVRPYRMKPPGNDGVAELETLYGLKSFTSISSALRAVSSARARDSGHERNHSCHQPAQSRLDCPGGNRLRGFRAHDRGRWRERTSSARAARSAAQLTLESVGDGRRRRRLPRAMNVVKDPEMREFVASAARDVPRF